MSHPGHFTAGKEPRDTLSRGPGGSRSHSDCLEKRKVSCLYLEW
jgi:hypothetical protein